MAMRDLSKFEGSRKPILIICSRIFTGYVPIPSYQCTSTDTSALYIFWCIILYYFVTCFCSNKITMQY